MALLVLGQVTSPEGIPSDPLQEGFNLVFASLFQWALIPAGKWQKLVDMQESLLSLLDAGHSNSSLALGIPIAQGLKCSISHLTLLGYFFFLLFFFFLKHPVLPLSSALGSSSGRRWLHHRELVRIQRTSSAPADAAFEG